MKQYNVTTRQWEEAAAASVVFPEDYAELMWRVDYRNKVDNNFEIYYKIRLFQDGQIQVWNTMGNRWFMFTHLSVGSNGFSWDEETVCVEPSKDNPVIHFYGW